MGSEAIIRNALPTEATELTSLGLRSKLVWGYSAEQMKTFRSELEITEARILSGSVFTLEYAIGAVVGYYSLLAIDDSTVELEHLFVDPAHLKQGYGSQLLSHAMTQARDAGFSTLTIQSDPNAVGFYERHGISVVKKVPSSIPNRLIPILELPL